MNRNNNCLLPLTRQDSIFNAKVKQITQNINKTRYYTLWKYEGIPSGVLETLLGNLAKANMISSAVISMLLIFTMLDR